MSRPTSLSSVTTQRSAAWIRLREAWLFSLLHIYYESMHPLLCISWCSFLYDGFPVLRLLGPTSRKHLISMGIPRWLGQCTALTIFMRMLIFSYISQRWEEFCKSRSSQRGSMAGGCSSNSMWGLCERSSGSSLAACSCSSSLFIASTKFLRFKLHGARVCVCWAYRGKKRVLAVPLYSSLPYSVKIGCLIEPEGHHFG